MLDLQHLYSKDGVMIESIEEITNADRYAFIVDSDTINKDKKMFEDFIKDYNKNALAYKVTPLFESLHN